MEVDKQLKFKSHQRLQVEFISNNVDVMTHDFLSSAAHSITLYRLPSHPGYSAMHPSLHYDISVTYPLLYNFIYFTVKMFVFVVVLLYD